MRAFRFSSFVARFPRCFLYVSALSRVTPRYIGVGSAGRYVLLTEFKVEGKDSLGGVGGATCFLSMCVPGWLALD